MKKYRKPLNMVNPLESIVEGEMSVPTDQRKLKDAIEEYDHKSRSGSVSFEGKLPEDIKHKKPRKQNNSSEALAVYKEVVPQRESVFNA